MVLKSSYKIFISLLLLCLSQNNSYGLRINIPYNKGNNKIEFVNYNVSNNFISQFHNPDTNKLEKLKEREIRSEHFYDSLRTIASQNTLTKKALSLVLVKGVSGNLQLNNESANPEEYFKNYQGKIIRTIEIIQLDVFNPSIYKPQSKTDSWVQKAGNYTHIKTKISIVKNNLFFAEGDTIDPAQLADNEVLLRSLDFIKDAFIQIMEIPENEDMIDVLVITKDVWSLGFSVNFSNSNSGSLELYENNLLGIGHKIEGSLFINTLLLPSTGYEFSYKVDNISNSFIKTRLNYFKAFETEKFGIEIWRRFHSYNTKYAGSIGIYQTSTIKNIKKSDTTLYNVRLNYSTQDFWLARSFQLNSHNETYKDRSRIVLGARFTSNYFNKGPEVSERYNYLYHNNQVLLGSVAFAQQKYYKTSLVYGFGKVEDIPVGNLIQLNIGYERDEFFKRAYTGINYASGIKLSKFGHINYLIDFGGFIYEDKLEQGLLAIKAQYITNIHYLYRLKHREFFSINYTRGISRFPDEYVYFDSNKDIWGFKSDNLFGKKKLVLRTESNAYTNLFLYNFRFVLFAFADLGFIGPEDKAIFKNKLFSGLGMGVRVRNENLVFKTLLIRFAYYPSIPTDTDYFYYMISGETNSRFMNFEPSAPYTIDFR